MREKEAGINGETSCVTIDKTSVEFSTVVTLVYHTEQLLEKTLLRTTLNNTNKSRSDVVLKSPIGKKGHAVA
jgi:hypothetical protein